MTIPGEFAEHFARIAADSDYSRYRKLQNTTSEDIRAAADALSIRATLYGMDHAELNRTLDEPTVLRTLLALENMYEDEGELVATEKQDFWDKVDDENLTFNLREQIRAELSSKLLAEKREQGCTVVDNAQGIWIFKLEG